MCGREGRCSLGDRAGLPSWYSGVYTARMMKVFGAVQMSATFRDLSNGPPAIQPPPTPTSTPYPSLCCYRSAQAMKIYDLAMLHNLPHVLACSVLKCKVVGMNSSSQNCKSVTDYCCYCCLYCPRVLLNKPHLFSLKQHDILIQHSRNKSHESLYIYIFKIM